MVPDCGLVQLILHLVDDVELDAMPVAAFIAVQAPCSDDEGGIFDTAAPRQVFVDRGDQKLGQLGRALQADARQVVLDVRVSKTFDQAVLVGVQVDPCHRVEHRRGLDIHEAAQIACEQRIRHAAIDGFVSMDRTEQPENRVPGVEQAYFHFLVGRDIGDKLRPDLFPGGPSIRKIVLDDPLGERLTGDRPCVFHACFASQVSDILRRCHRRDPVHHGIGETHFAFDPVRKLGILFVGESQQHLARHVAVVLDVVARLNGEGREPGGAAFFERSGQITEHHLRAGGIFQVVLHIGIVELELTRGGVEVVAAFGDGQRNDPGVRTGHLVDDGVGIVAAQQKIDE